MQFSSRSCRHVIAESAAEFDRILHEHAVVVELPDEDAETAYVAIDERLCEQLESLFIEIFGKGHEEFCHQNWDWWPTRTRFLWFGSEVISWALIDLLQERLVGDVEDWRININVLVNLAGENCREVGGLNVYRDRVAHPTPGLSTLARFLRR